MRQNWGKGRGVGTILKGGWVSPRLGVPSVAAEIGRNKAGLYIDKVDLNTDMNLMVHQFYLAIGPSANYLGVSGDSHFINVSLDIGLTPRFILIFLSWEISSET